MIHWIPSSISYIPIRVVDWGKGGDCPRPRGHLEAKYGGLGFDAALLRFDGLVLVASIYACDRKIYKIL